MSEYKRTIGALPPTLQGIALDLSVGEKVAITTEEHHSVHHGKHFDVYFMERISESEVNLWKHHSDILLRAGLEDQINNAINRPLTEEDTKDIRSGGC